MYKKINPSSFMHKQNLSLLHLPHLPPSWVTHSQASTGAPTSACMSRPCHPLPSPLRLLQPSGKKKSEIQAQLGMLRDFYHEDKTPLRLLRIVIMMMENMKTSSGFLIMVIKSQQNLYVISCLMMIIINPLEVLVFFIIMIKILSNYYVFLSS